MKQGEFHIRGSGENIKWPNVYSPAGNPVIIWKWEKQSQAWKFWEPEKLWNSCVSESDKNQLGKISGIVQWHGEHIIIRSFIQSIIFIEYQLNARHFSSLVTMVTIF